MANPNILNPGQGRTDLPHMQMVEQKITKQVSIANGASDSVSITIPQNRKVFLKGYGYTFFSGSTYQLDNEITPFIARQDQEGSIMAPMVYGRPFPCRSGGKLYLRITNASGSTRTYDVVFYILTDEFLNESCTGSEMTVTTGVGSAAGAVVIYDSTITTAASVTSNGLQVEANAPATLRDGTGSAIVTAAAIGSSTALKQGVLIQCDSGSANGLKVGNATSQSFELEPGDAMFIPINDLAKVYVIRNGGSDSTYNYNAA